jgi:ABC-2 type transport system permease protein
MTAATAPAPAGLVPASRAVTTEAAKGLALLWRRRPTLVMTTVTVGLMYLVVDLFIGGGHIVRPLLAATLPAAAAYALAATTATSGSGGIAEEVNGGTLEQSQLTPARPALLVAGRLAALAAEGLIPAAVLAGAIWTGFGLGYTVRPAVLVPLVLTIADALAYGLLMIALTLAVTSIGAVVHVFNMSVMFFGGMLVPVTAFPHGVQVLAAFVPTTLGVHALNVTLSGAGLGAAWHDGILPWLIAHVLITAAVAAAAYAWTLRRARRAGGLAPR